ncbi:MAG: phenylalanine--tRNA ligase subunit beta, partial [Candidatus Cloacimonetes bacterium]|nr:phenylalanine--tRNA ligase subunit beta [Candidatus Cloacimonadota bacterium]
VVCGAPNCDTGNTIAFAPLNSKIGDFKIKKVKLRGEESCGMICSEKELGLSKNHEGIMVLPNDAPLGKNLFEYLNFKDTCFDVEITPNRPDLLGIIGVARDMAAVMSLPLNLPKIGVVAQKEKIETQLFLQNDVASLCTRYTVRLIKNVKIGESPKWLKERLLSVGLRPINNVVDITNFVMMEFGHPLHAFDFAKIKGQKIIIRNANEGEKFEALDEKKYDLKNTDIVIADTEKAIALAGVIGGVNSQITAETADIVLEVANFNYSSIRNTRKRLVISTDSSYRFERNIADESVKIVSDRATQLILEIAGGELFDGILDSYPNPQKSTTIELRKSRVEKLLAIEISKEKIAEYLQKLGLKLLAEKDDVQIYEIPPYRKDLTREIDLIEEIIRLYGYNKRKSNLQLQRIMNKKEFYNRRLVKNGLVENGFSEVKNWNFDDPANLDKLKIAENDQRRNFVMLKNPLGSSFSIMRSTLIPALLKNALFNVHHGQKDLKIFEFAKIFTRKEQKLANEKWTVAGLMTGKLHPTFWKEKEQKLDFFDLKGVVEEIFERLNISGLQYRESTEKFYQPNFALGIKFAGKEVGSFGKLDEKIAVNFDIEQEIFAFELKLDTILNLNIQTKFKEIPKFPPILRDISFLISENFNYTEIIKSIQKADKTIRKIELFDEFKGKNIPKGKRSLTFSLVFSSDEKTLTDDFIVNVMNTVIKILQKKYQIEMR